MSKIGILLSGCGYLDGAEVHEATLTLLALSKQDVEYQGIAPDRDQHHVMNHCQAEESAGASRNILQESARIMRGNVIALSEAQASDYAAIIVPGGFGAAKNLFNLALVGVEYTLQPDVQAFLQSAVEAKLPMGLICISPMMAPLIYPAGVTITTGEDADMAKMAESRGAKNVVTPVDDIVIDAEHKLVCTPAYMYGEAEISQVAKGIDKLVAQIVAWL